MGMLDIILGDTTLGKYKGKSREVTKVSYSVSSDDLERQTNLDLIEIRATQIKAAEAIESVSRLERGAASEFKGLATDLREIRDSSDGEIASIMKTYNEHSLHSTANTYRKLLEIAAANDGYVVNRSVTDR